MECSEPDCRATLRELDAFLDGEMPPDARDAIHRHLELCPDCHSAFDFEAELKAMIQAKCAADEMPPGLLDRIERCFDTDFNGDGVIGLPD